jgi:hypothetical protein
MSYKSLMPAGFSGMVRATMALAAAALIAAACGGGGGAGGSTSISGVGSGGTGIGVITGFGSLILDGVRRSDTGATYSSESSQGAAVTVPLTSAVLGQSAEYAYDASGNVTSVLLSPNFVGPVSAVSASSITILGTRISANTDPSLGPVTSFVGYASLADVKVGDKVEAHGFMKTDGQGNAYLQATLIMKRPSLTGVRLTGVVSQYSANAGSFALGGAIVTVGSATISPAGAALANGQLVTVWSGVIPSGNAVAATTIRIKKPASGNGNVTLSGPIANFVSLASFQIGNVSVDATAAAITPSGVNLANNQYVVLYKNNAGGGENK